MGITSFILSSHLIRSEAAEGNEVWCWFLEEIWVTYQAVTAFQDELSVSPKCQNTWNLCWKKGCGIPDLPQSDMGLLPDAGHHACHDRSLVSIDTSAHSRYESQEVEVHQEWNICEQHALKDSVYLSVEKHGCRKADRQLTVKLGNSVSFEKSDDCTIVFGKLEIRREMTAE